MMYCGSRELVRAAVGQMRKRILRLRLLDVCHVFVASECSCTRHDWHLQTTDRREVGIDKSREIDRYEEDLLTQPRELVLWSYNAT